MIYQFNDENKYSIVVENIIGFSESSNEGGDSHLILLLKNRENPLMLYYDSLIDLNDDYKQLTYLLEGKEQ